MDVNIEIDELSVDGPDALALRTRLIGLLDGTTADAVVAAVGEALRGADSGCTPDSRRAPDGISTTRADR